MINRRKVLATGIAGTVFAPAVLRAQTRYKSEYKMSSAPPGAVFAWGRGAEDFATLVRERTNGRINIKPYWSASLMQGQQDREFSAMRQGIVDVLCGAPINWSSTVKEFGIFMLPFLFPDHRAYDAVIASQAITGDFFDLVRRSGAEPLAIGETGYRQISNSKRPIILPGDLRGLKIRVAGSPMFQDTLSTLGANPASMSWSDAAASLSTGAVDGQENPLEVFVAAKLHSLGQKYVTKWNCTNDILLFAIANPIWESWTKEDQTQVRSAAIDAARAQIKLVRDLYANDVDAVRKVGVEAHVSTPAEIAQWIEATRAPYTRWKANLAPQLVTKIGEVVAATRRA